MKPQKHKTAVRIFCLVVAVLMVLSLFSTVFSPLPTGHKRKNSKEPSEP